MNSILRKERAWTQIQFVAKYKNTNYNFVKLTSEELYLMFGMIPKTGEDITDMVKVDCDIFHFLQFEYDFS